MSPGSRWYNKMSLCPLMVQGSKGHMDISLYEDVLRKLFVQCDIHMSPMSPGSGLFSEMSICPLCPQEAVCTVRCLYVPYVPGKPFVQ